MSTLATCFSDRLSGMWVDPEEEESEGRIITLEEFMERLRNRPDIFGMERNYRLRNAELLALFIAVLAGMWAASREELPRLSSGPGIAPSQSPSIVTFKPGTVENPLAPANPNPSIRAIHPDKRIDRPISGAPGKRPIRIAGIMKKGILGMLSNLSLAGGIEGDPSGKGGIYDRISQMISGPMGLKAGGNPRSAPNGDLDRFGFASSDGALVDESGGKGINGLIDVLLQKKETGFGLVKKTGPPPEARPERIALEQQVSTAVGARKKSEIMQVVMANMAALRYAYTRRLRDKPNLKGKITLRFAIDEFGRVIRCDVIESSVNDPDLEKALVAGVLLWQFGRIDNPGDITEVIFPFVFSS